MKTILPLPIILLFSILMTTELHAESGPSVFDQGLDGNVRYYKVVCPSGKRTSLNYNISTKETCTTSVNGSEEICKTNWKKEDAAKEACK